ncbi:MAG: cupin domain-containing protein [Thaumarchaeota archaeon]|nr:cupin domain-containing protein [Nitrososphaerota archaeon]
MPRIVKVGEVKPVDLEGGGGFRRIAIEKATGAEKLQLMFIDLEPNRRGPYHYHSSAEQITFVVDGSGELVVEGKRYTVERDHVVFFQPKEKHSVNAGKKGMKLIEIYSPPDPDFVRVQE